uniref:Uncharacterized protein n=1 Tax=Piliocolobus tephrosceles TaxID=591936 RepID=A0A8C9H5V5_9PRIM
MGHNHNKLNLPPTNRPKITYCVFLRKPYGSSNCSFPHSNPLKLHWRNYPYNCSRTHFVYIILPSKLKL